MDALPRLFDPFYRVDEARARNTGGIGLAICSRAMRLHGGMVSASPLPSGLAIRLTLPADLVQADNFAVAAVRSQALALERLP